MDVSESALIDTIERFEQSQQEWMLFLEKLKRNHLNKVYAANGISFYNHLQGIIQHDADHPGQIVLLVKHFTPVASNSRYLIPGTLTYTFLGYPAFKLFLYPAVCTLHLQYFN